MQWLNDFSDWFLSTNSRPVIFAAAVLGIAIIVSGLLSAWIARGVTGRLIAQRDAEIKATAIAALIDASTEASVWNSLTPQEQVLSDRAVGQADIQVRMLPIRGSAIAANWASHQLHELKRASATFGYQLDPAVAEFRDRLLEWQSKPSRARKVFASDLERWKAANSETERTLLAEQDAWVAQQHQAQFGTSSATPASPAAPAAPVAAPGTSLADTQKLLDDVDALRKPEITPAQPTNAS